MTQATKAVIGLVKGDDGIWLCVEGGGRSAMIHLNEVAKGPLTQAILMEWAESQFQQPDPIQVLRDLFETGDLEDHYYDIREREGLGWDSPRMLKWGAACAAARKLMYH